LTEPDQQVMWPPVPVTTSSSPITNVPRLDQRNEADESLSEAAVAAIVFAAAACLLPLAVLLAKICRKSK
jgi:hypothetical protein